MAIPGSRHVAAGNIRPCRFVIGNNDPYECVEASSAGERTLGISQEAGTVAPIPEVTTIYAGTAGLPMRVFENGEECLLELSGTVQAGTEIQTHTDGTGIAASTADYVGAIAQTDGASGDFILVRVCSYEKNA